jgi:hypothetical protein
MSEAVLFAMAECTRPCGWVGSAHERFARGDATEALLCPQCSGWTRSWVVDQAKDQADLDRLKAERLESLLKSNQKAQQARLAHERLHDARRQTERARHTVAMLDPDDRAYLAAKGALVAAQQQEAEAFLARAQAMAAIKGRG